MAKPHSIGLQVRDICKAFGTYTALDGVSLDVEPGELACLLGPSGCGKTTLLRCIAGLEHQDRGTVVLGSKDVSMLPPQARDYGILFQSYALFPNLTVEQNIGYGLSIKTRSEVRTRVAEMLDLVGLQGIERKYPNQLSGGQQQRVALARALAPAPSLLLLDEPMSALDAQVREHLCTELRALQKRLGTTTVMVTHNQEEALLMADRIAVINQGRVEQYATPRDLYRTPATAFVAQFIGQGNWLPFSEHTNGVARVGALEVRVACMNAARNGRLFCRPEAIQLNPPGTTENTFSAHMHELTFLGNRCRVHFELDAMPGHAMFAELSPDAVPRLAGRSLRVALPSDSLQVFA
ncbi:putative 2-aminoethylphosphonate ABC transporter ATP-binding protein [Pseudomonas sp. Marseille-QA0892]